MAVWRRWIAVFVALLVVCAASTSGVQADEAVTTAPVPAPTAPTRAKASHILVDTEEQADEILAELRETKRLLKEFARIAGEKSKCPSGKKGGDLGWFDRGRMVPAFDAAVFEQEPRKLYKVKTQFGWHVIYTTRLGEQRVGEDSTEDTWHRTLVYYLNKAAPFISPIILIVIFFYGQRSALKIDGPKARASHILVKTEAEADELFKEIKKASDPKAKLAELAATKSSCPSGKKGGDLGLFSKGQMVPAFEKIAFEKEVGSVHKVETQFGWHVILVNERIGDKVASTKTEKKTDKKNK